MGAIPPSERTALCRDFNIIKQQIARGITQKRNITADNTWDIWSNFCATLGIEPGLSEVNDPVPYLLLFGLRYRDGRLAPRGKQVRARTAEDAIRFVGQAFAAVGAHDPRLNAHGKLDFRLARLIRSWKKEDPPAKRKKPVPVAVLDEATSHARRNANPANQAISDLIWIGFFWLLRPGEYLFTPTGTPFLLRDVYLKANGMVYRADEIPLRLLALVTDVGLKFNEQKNQIKGEIIWLSRSRNPRRCPVTSVVRRVNHLRGHHTPSTTPLYSYYDDDTSHHVSDRDLTAHLRYFASLLHLDVDVTAGALRCTGASALLNAHVPKELIQLIGRWHSDEVFRYLHTESTTLMQPLAQTMAHNIC